MSSDQQWNDLAIHLNKWFYKPDLDALRIALSVQLSHFWLSDKPVWLSILGPPGCGKTEILIRAIEYCRDTYSISSLTSKSFLSGYGEDIGILSKLLPKPNGSGILSFPDLSTTLLTESPDERVRIMGIMRRVFDGKYDKEVGNRGKKLTWEGKVTCIAACTPDIEDYWALHRDFGERWLNMHIRLNLDSMDDMIKYSEKASSQVGNEETIQKKFKTLIKGIVSKGLLYPEAPITPELSKKTDALAVLLELLRTNVKREFMGNRLAVTGRGNMQLPTRTAKNLVSIARGAASLRCSNSIDDCDYLLARRVALDSIPSKRYKIIQLLLDLFPDWPTHRELSMAVGFPRASFDRILEDLRVLGVCQVERDDNSTEELDQLLSTSDDIELDANNAYIMGKAKSRDKIALTSNIINILSGANMVKTAQTGKISKTAMFKIS